MPRECVDVVVVGGGLAGLAAATFLAREGRRVVLFERGARMGGRARSVFSSGFHFNQGPHALYRAGAAVTVLSELGVKYSGASPEPSGGYAIASKRLHTFPAGVLSLLTTGLLQPAEKVEAGRLLSGLDRLDTRAFASVPLEHWLRDEVSHEGVRRLLRALARLATYTDNSLALSAGAAIDQLRLALRGVVYIDGGWQTLVNGLVQISVRAGVKLNSSQAVVAVMPDANAARVVLRNGHDVLTHSVVIATGPREAQALMRDSAGGQALSDWLRAATPVRLACLDVALRTLPRARALFALGIDEPMYASVHSAVGRLAPGGEALIHVARYGGTTAAASVEVREELADVLDRLQPGWRDVVVRQRFLPDMIVSHAIVTAAQGGVSGRPRPEVPGAPGVYVIGDWVGSEGMLADAALASARCAAVAILKRAQVAESICRTN